MVVTSLVKYTFPHPESCRIYLRSCPPLAKDVIYRWPLYLKISELKFPLFGPSFMHQYFLFSAVAIHFLSVTELK